MSDLDHVSGPKDRLGRLDTVDQDAVAAAEIADHDLAGARHELDVAAREQGIGFADVARGIAADDHRADEQELALTFSVVDDQLAAHAGSIRTRTP